ncbi:esterase-like activity of phytase family protein [Actinophytocola sp.]|uniref:esterase-like activity of phytase family protein n=1 Tax=Actinophytocola sp. TaxID=1872138 RepID=UPI002ED1CBF3
MRTRVLASSIAAALVAGLVISPVAAAAPGVRLLGERIIPPGTFEGTTVGGLSGIDRDPRTGGYVLISDDRSTLQPARFYTATIDVNARGLGEVKLTGTDPFLRADGTTYPTGTVDPEDIRVDPWTGDYLWSQEGDRVVQPDRQVLIDPSIQFAKRDGSHVRTLPLPPVERMSAENRGPRQNQALEALTFAGGGSLVVSAMEGALLQDGPEATPANGTLSRITVQTRSGRVLAQYAYPQEPVFTQPNPPGSFSNNGVTAILASGHGRFLLLERSFVTGVGNKVRLFEIDVRGAANVAGLDSLAGRDVRPVRKKLVADLADFDLSTVDNIEGMTWGPTLRTGERTLVLVSDNNFAASQVSQVVALALR